MLWSQQGFGRLGCSLTVLWKLRSVLLQPFSCEWATVWQAQVRAQIGPTWTVAEKLVLVFSRLLRPHPVTLCRKQFLKVPLLKCSRAPSAWTVLRQLPPTTYECLI